MPVGASLLVRNKVTLRELTRRYRERDMGSCLERRVTEGENPVLCFCSLLLLIPEYHEPRGSLWESGGTTPQG